MILAKSPSRLVIATRESRLALWQAEHVRAALMALYPDCEVLIDGMTTKGDRILDQSLSKVGGKGLFIKELETALHDGRCDIAVHSLKDVPMTLAPEFVLAAVLLREDARDAFVSNRYASPRDLPQRARVGTSSLRREAQLRARFPHLIVEPVRGNVDTRLAKLDRGEFDAILLAAAGLTRLGLAERIRMRLDPEDSLPSAGQGALAIEIRDDRSDLMCWMRPLHHAQTALAVTAERAVSRTLGGSCTMPLGAYATWSDGGELVLAALVARSDGSALVSANGRAVLIDLNDNAAMATAEALGQEVGQRLIAKGALALLDTA